MTIVAAVFGFFLVIQSGAWFLAIHVGYYSVANRIHNLANYIEPAEVSKKKNRHVFAIKTKRIDVLPFSVQQGRTLKKLRACGYLFDHLSRACNALNFTFSLPILVNLVTSLVMCTVFLYLVIYQTICPSPFGSLVSGQMMIFMSSVTFMLIMLMAPDMPINEVGLR